MAANKAVAGGLGAALSQIVVWALNQYLHAGIPDAVGGSITTVITAGLVYFTPNAKGA